jgi:hypothetical protein
MPVLVLVVWLAYTNKLEKIQKILLTSAAFSS